MKIIEADEPRKGWYHDFRCTGRNSSTGKGCGKVIEISQHEIEYFEYKDQDQAMVQFYGFRCPGCGALTQVYPEYSKERETRVKLTLEESRELGYPPGALAKAFETEQAVLTGTVEAGGGFPAVLV